MTTQKKNTKKTASSSNLVTNNVVASVPAPPTAAVPTAPVGFDPTTMIIPRGGGRARASVASSAANVSAEIENSTTFTQDFGTKIPAPELAGLLADAAGWRQVRNESSAWLDYVKYGDAQVWLVVQRELERFRKVYAAAVAIDASVPARYPKLDALFQAMSAPAKRAVSTRKKKKAQATTPAAVPATASPATVAPPAPATPPAQAKTAG